MDQGLKARLIGASILVVLAVLLLPELLSGPHDSKGGAAAPGGKGTRTVVIDLSGAIPTAAQLEPREDPAPQPAAAPALPAAASAPPPATAAERSQIPPDESGPATEDESPTPPSPSRAAVPASTPTSVVPSPAAPEPLTAPTKGGYSVQVGAFGSAAGARKLVDDLKAAGMPAYLLLPAQGKKLHRVRVGPVPDRAAADKLAAKLKARGLPVSVVANG